MDVKCAQLASSEAKFTTSTKTSVHPVPRSIVLNGYKGKHTLGSDDTYLHFLNTVYRMAKSVIIMRNVVIQALNWVAIFCFPSAPLSLQFCGSVVGWKLNLSGYAGGKVNAFTLADGFTNLYSSITAEPRIMLSTICERNIDMTINAMSAIIPRMEDTNSNFLHPSALLKNLLNLLYAFRY